MGEQGGQPEEAVRRFMQEVYKAAGIDPKKPHRVILSGGMALDEASKKSQIQGEVETGEKADYSYIDLSRERPAGAFADVLVHVPIEHFNKQYGPDTEMGELLKEVSKPERDIYRISASADYSQSYALPALRARMAIRPGGIFCIGSIMEPEVAQTAKAVYELTGQKMGYKLVGTREFKVDLPGSKNHVVLTVLRVPVGQRLITPLSKIEEDILNDLKRSMENIEILHKRRELYDRLNKQRERMKELLSVMEDPKRKLKERARAARWLRELFEEAKAAEAKSRSSPYKDLHRNFIREHEAHYTKAEEVIDTHESVKAVRAKLEAAAKRIERYHEMLKRETDPERKARLATLIYTMSYRVNDGADAIGMEHFVRGGIYSRLFEEFNRRIDRAISDADEHLGTEEMVKEGKYLRAYPDVRSGKIRFQLPKHLAKKEQPKRK